jgi:chemotaxis protein MotB
MLIFFVLLISASRVQTGKMEKIIAAVSQGQAEGESLTSAAEKVSKTLEEQNLKKDVSVKVTDEGLEVSFNAGVTFASGQADVLPEMEAPLGKVLDVLKPYSERYHMAVEGHTDETPMRSGVFKSNWELSSARAMRIRERLEQVGINPKRLRVEAYADNKPAELEQEQGLDRAAFLARQRRVVIRLY